MRPTSSTRSSGWRCLWWPARGDADGEARASVRSRRIRGSRECGGLRRHRSRGRACGAASRVEGDWRGSGDRPADVGKPAHQPDAGRNLRQQLECPRQPAHRIVRILRFFEAHGRVGTQFQRGRCLAKLADWKFALSRTMRRGRAEMALSRPPMTPAMAMGRPRRQSPDSRRRGRTLRRSARGSFASRGRAHENGVARELRAVEGVHGLGEFRHDEVGQVDDVVDRIQPDRVSRYCSQSGEAAR